MTDRELKDCRDRIMTAATQGRMSTSEFSKAMASISRASANAPGWRVMSDVYAGRRTPEEVAELLQRRTVATRTPGDPLAVLLDWTGGAELHVRAVVCTSMIGAAVDRLQPHASH